MTYVEGASLHQERGGSTVFARYAFNELLSFVAGWAILLDYVILLAVTAFTATNYLARVLEPARARRRWRSWSRSAVIACVGVINVRGVERRRAAARVADRRRRRHRACSCADRAGPGAGVRTRTRSLDPIDLGTRADLGRHGVRADDRDGRLHRPGGGRRAWPARCAISAPRPAPAGAAGRRGDRSSLYVGIALVARQRAARRGGATALGGATSSRRRCSAVVDALRPGTGCADVLRYAGRRPGAVIVLVAAAQLGDARALAAGLLARRPTARSPARSGACTRRARRRTC